MEPKIQISTKHPATFCWPPILVILSIIIGRSIGTSRPEAFRYIHVYFEILMLIGFIAACGYTIKLWKQRANSSLWFPLYSNMAIVLLIFVVFILSFIIQVWH